jgi:hypothetical protein
MTNVFVDPSLSDAERRARLFAGDLFVYSPTPSSEALCAFAREMAEEAFAPYYPPDAQHHLDNARYVEILAALKPAFINHPRCKELLRGVLGEVGCDVDTTYFDVPRLRTMTSEYLNAGLTYQFHPHRDTWFSAPMSQVNWWLPVYELHETNSMAFHPRYFSEPVRNSSSDYNYGEWVQTGRQAAASQVSVETRKQPEALDTVEREPETRIIPQVGGLLLFSGAQLHTTVTNTSGRTRFSIDFRTVDLSDIEQHRGAPNIDSHCTGTTLGDFLRVSDYDRVPADLVAAYDTAPVRV